MTPAGRFERLSSLQEVLDLVNWHNENSDFLVIDTETTSTNPREAELLDCQLSGTEDDHVVIFKGDYREALREIGSHITLVAHNAKYDLAVLFNHGVNLLDHKFRCTILLGHLLDENRASYSLSSYIKEYFDVNFKDQFWEKYKSYADASEEDKVLYGCRDVLYTRSIYQRFVSALSGQGIPGELVEAVHRLQLALLRTEIAGISVDAGYLEEVGVKVGKRLEEIKPEMRSLARDEIDIIELRKWQEDIAEYKSDKGKARCPRPEFSFDSPKQLIDLVYGELGCTPQRNEKTKAISTDYDSLMKVKDEHPVIEKILEYRELAKVQGSYIEGTIDRMRGGRIYPEFRVNGTLTGRISSSNPNMQQLPREGGIRGIYTADPGHVIISADYSSLEIFLAANFTKDPGLLRIVLNGESMHDVTAAGLGIDRQLAKSVNFAEGYGCSHFKVAKLLGVSEQEGLAAHNRYWTTYSGQKKKMDECKAMIDRGDPIITPWGRRRRFEVRNRSPWDKAYRQGWNFLVQSTGADGTNLAFSRYSEHLAHTGRGRGMFPIHDEILAQVKEEYAEEELALLVKVMEDVWKDIHLDIPIKATPSQPSYRWQD